MSAMEVSYGIEIRDVIDSEDLLELWAQSISGHLSTGALAKRHQRKVWSEEVAVCEILLKEKINIQSTTGGFEKRKDHQRTVLCYAGALEGLGRRQGAIDCLRSCILSSLESDNEEILYDEDFKTDPAIDGDDALLSMCHDVTVQMILAAPVVLALTKLYFKHGLKSCALKWCDLLCSQIHPNSYHISLEDASDAFHLAGWIRIHNDDHTGAYQMWTQGHERLPHCESLARQYQKRSCWDMMESSLEEEWRSYETEMVGKGAIPQSIGDLEGFVVPSGLRTKTPALSLFDSTTQQNQLVFRSKEPVLTSSECAVVLKNVQDFIHIEQNGKWSTVRQSSVTTTDVAVEDIALLRPWLRELLLSRLYPLIAVAYPKLADGSSIVDNMGNSRMRVHDAFIVRYDADRDGSFSLPEHFDTSAVSFTVALNDQEGNFEGGGTWFEALGEDGGLVVDAKAGHAVSFAGPLRHAGYPVTKGCRIILVLFLYVEDFSYGRCLEEYAEEHGICCDGSNENDSKHSDKEVVRPSGDMPGGYVVYNQTVQLTKLINRRVESVLD